MPSQSPSKKPCLECGSNLCYRWYKGPKCANCYRRAAYKADPEKHLRQDRAWRAKNPNKNKEYCRKKYHKNSEHYKAQVKLWQEKNPEKVKVYQKKSSAKPENKLRRSQYGKKHYRENKHLYRAKDARYRAAKLQRTPPWADLEAIKAFYEACPLGYHVDHIIPLQGKIVSGLHVLENLQYLPAEENLSKGNRFDG